jgi:hypothetical protein
MIKNSLGIEAHKQNDLDVFQKKLKDLIISRGFISRSKADMLSLPELLKHVVIIYLPDSDYYQLVEIVEDLEKNKNVS